MAFIAILGAGSIGGALAHTLAARSRVPHIRLIDSDGRVAEGKALDILQSSPIEAFSTRVSAASDIDAAVGADVVVIADDVAGDAEPGLAVLKQLFAIDTAAPIVFAGPSHRTVMMRAIAEL